jgi:hypothetical protein
MRALSRMLGGFRSQRTVDDADAVAVLDGLRHVLRGFPLWAIEQGCDDIHLGRALLDGSRLTRAFAPNDAEIVGVIEQLVAPYRKLLASATALLSAPVQQKDPPR